jgi:phosphohistidine phosphatase SixA
MKKLFLVRHAKAEEASVGEKDIDRTLHNKGLMDAPRMGRIIAEEAIRPQKLVSSPEQEHFKLHIFLQNN